MARWYDDPGERDRVYTRIAPRIMEFYGLHPDELFHVEELRVFVCDRVPEIAPDSPGRILRALRLEGRLDYEIINRRESLYHFCGDGRRMKKLTIPEIRHCMLALAQKIGGADGDLLKYLAEQTRRAPRGSKGGQDEAPPPEQASAPATYQGNGALGDHHDENQPQG